ncbi:hypothetical protein LAZ67_3006169 [Cordylochernes scorpioides]|uniref:Uncharacterized protein n=1 Tax=Cordylochernes scorpioides TaxID=51811 RepID=A0ABY6KCA4_9ARAC|nr:hypothetical protein LAZ67_3006169 [Cordylochernes scorpioides]
MLAVILYYQRSCEYLRKLGRVGLMTGFEGWRSRPIDRNWEVRNFRPLLTEADCRKETTVLEGPGPGDEWVLHCFSEPNLDKVAIYSQLCRRQDGKGVVLKAGPAEEPGL